MRSLFGRVAQTRAKVSRAVEKSSHSSNKDDLRPTVGSTCGCDWSILEIDLVHQGPPETKTESGRRIPSPLCMVGTNRGGIELLPPCRAQESVNKRYQQTLLASFLPRRTLALLHILISCVNSGPSIQKGLGGCMYCSSNKDPVLYASGREEIFMWLKLESPCVDSAESSLKRQNSEGQEE